MVWPPSRATDDAWTPPAVQDAEGETGRRPSRRPLSPAAKGALGAAVVLVPTLIAALVAALIGFGFGADAAGAQAAATATASAEPTEAAEPTVSEIYDASVASVVVITTADGALGSGVVAAEDGSVLTAAHVVDDGSAITVTFADGTVSTATVASTDAATDIATLTPATLPEVLVPATIGGGVGIGDAVLTISNPLGLAFSATTGIVSGIERTAVTEVGELSGLIQIDAAANPGSSGGPVFAADGTVVGIIVAIADPGGDDAFAGIAFAVPIGSSLGGGGDGEAAPQI